MESHDNGKATEHIAKSPTGIEGFDEITGGGLPHRRTTLLVGASGSGKTIFALQTLVNGARLYGQPGVFVAFEESSQQTLANVASFGWDLPGLTLQKLLFLDARISADVVFTGGFDLTGMLAGISDKAAELSAANDGAPVRVVFDAIDVPLAFMNDLPARRREIYRLHDWLANRSLFGIITAKYDTFQNGLPRDYEFMQYMADCVIELRRHVVVDGVPQRSLTVIKYRGSSFAENEHSVVIGAQGLVVPSLSIFDLSFPVSSERISTGIERLDAMLDGGYLRGSSTLVTGAPGTAKSTLGGAFAEAACQRGERTLRHEKEAADRQAQARQRAENERPRRELELQRDETKARLATLRREIAQQETELRKLKEEEQARQDRVEDEVEALKRLRGADRLEQQRDGGEGDAP